jgi:hypothetical protein
MAARLAAEAAPGAAAGAAARARRGRPPTTPAAERGLVLNEIARLL